MASDKQKEIDEWGEDLANQELSQTVALYYSECLWGLDSVCGTFPPSEDTGLILKCQGPLRQG